MIVVIQKVVAGKIGNVEIHVAVVVVVSGDNCFRERRLVDARGMGDVFEGSVAFIDEELAGSVLVSYKEIEKAVVVDIRPNRGLSVRSRFR